MTYIIYSIYVISYIFWLFIIFHLLKSKIPLINKFIWVMVSSVAFPVGAIYYYYKYIMNKKDKTSINEDICTSDIKHKCYKAKVYSWIFIVLIVFGYLSGIVAILNIIPDTIPDATTGKIIIISLFLILFTILLDSSTGFPFNNIRNKFEIWLSYALLEIGRASCRERV